MPPVRRGFATGLARQYRSGSTHPVNCERGLLFVDANILVSVVNKEYPLFSNAARIMSMAGQRGVQVFTTPVWLTIAFYFAEKKHRPQKAKEKINLLCQHISIAPVTQECVQQALADKEVQDFDEGVHYYAALAQHCDCPITEDVDDVCFSPMVVFNSKAFLQQHRF